jgi:hypothetical protein
MDHITGRGEVVREDTCIMITVLTRTYGPSAGCPQVSGYTLTAGADHFGDDINCQETGSAQTAASRCSADPACKAFNTYTSGDAAWACTKRVSGPTTLKAGICFFTKAEGTEPLLLVKYRLSR